LIARLRAADLLALVPAAAIPLVFLHARYQLVESVGPLSFYGSDIVILLTLAAALVAGVAYGWRPLARTWVLWLVAGAFVAYFGISCFWTPVERLTKHLTTWSKLLEYALLAPALVLLLRRRAHVERFLLAFAGWAVVAALWGLLEFLGVVKEFEGYRPGRREVSFLGIYDFAVFAGATFSIGLAALFVGERRRIVPVALAAGAVGVALAASVFSFLSLVVASAVAAVVSLRRRLLSVRRAALIGAVLVVVAAGVAVLRGSDITDYLSFLGVRKQPLTTTHIASGPQRTMLAYIGLRIWLDHPLLGVGFDRSPNRYQPYLAAAKRRFPSQDPLAYPSPQHEWGVQSFWLQLLADGGVVGFGLGVATFASAIVLALRATRREVLLGLVAAGWLLVAAGTWIGEEFIVGIPLEAVTWLGVGLSAVVGGLE